MDTTANTADSYVRRTSIQRQIREGFAAGNVGDEALQLVSTLTEIVLDQVAQARGMAADTEGVAAFRDHAECGSLYGFVLGYRMALGVVAATIPIHTISGD